MKEILIKEAIELGFEPQLLNMSKGIKVDLGYVNMAECLMIEIWIKKHYNIYIDWGMMGEDLDKYHAEYIVRGNTIIGCSSAMFDTREEAIIVGLIIAIECINLYKYEKIN